mgnify:CR=1 FL=1
MNKQIVVKYNMDARDQMNPLEEHPAQQLCCPHRWWVGTEGYFLYLISTELSCLWPSQLLPVF